MEISKFQELIKEIYLKNDSARGIDKTFIWFIEEVGELAEEIRKSEVKTRAMESEFADVFAWLVTLANLYDIDLEKCVKKKYPGKCPGCFRNPCICGV
ncbi:MAG: nucleotide pyrophosphohydrolase [Candidatus Altiarchaeales archaeon HGW-Altiarchaeales-3]|nr:MAG: nucleotide pyrophosphohydrolase [Candidatus Altiarchaeales archaeon HGW-Altiarchaeales-3]